MVYETCACFKTALCARVSYISSLPPFCLLLPPNVESFCRNVVVTHFAPRGIFVPLAILTSEVIFPRSNLVFVSVLGKKRTPSCSLSVLHMVSILQSQAWFLHEKIPAFFPSFIGELFPGLYCIRGTLFASR